MMLSFIHGDDRSLGLVLDQVFDIGMAGQSAGGIAPDRIRFDGHVEVGVKMAAEICRRLRFSNDETEQILALVDNHMRFADVQRMNQSTLKKFLRLPAFDEHLELHRIDCLSSHGQLDSYEYSREQLALAVA